MQKDLESFKGRFISTLSHELKTPLNCTINMLELLEFDLVIEREKNLFLLEKLMPALNSSKLLVSNINDIIDYSELVCNKFLLRPSKFYLRELLSQLIDLVSISVKERGNSIQMEYDKNLGESIISDEARISQVILNLLSNANKFTINGNIKLRAQEAHDKSIKITVKDTGSGIKKEDLKKIGILGGSNNKNLVGLGLTIANYIASVLSPPNNRGIFARSRVGKGSTFSFYIQSLSKHRLKRSNFSNLNKLSETYEQITLNELVHIQSSSKNSRSEKKSLEEDDDTVMDNMEERSEEEMQSPYNIENLKRRDEEETGLLLKNINLLDNLNEERKFLDSLSQPSKYPADFQEKEIKSEIKSIYQESSMTHSSGKELIIQEFVNFQKLFPIPSSISILFNKSPKPTLTEIDQNNQSVPADITKASSLSNFPNFENFSKHSRDKPVTRTEIHSRNKNFLNSYEEFDDLEKLTKRSTERKKTNERNRSVIFETDLENLDIPSFKKEIKFENVKDLVSFLKNKKSCACPDILLVDDNGYNLMVLRLMVESLGFKADTAKSGDEAISLVKNRISGGTCPHCQLYYIIFMDIDMPEKDGLETTLEVLELFRDKSMRPVVIACTAFHESEFGQQCFSVGMKDFISKPVKRDLLEKMLLNYFSTILS